jgi:hypothetical protein
MGICYQQGLGTSIDINKVQSVFSLIWKVFNQIM